MRVALAIALALTLGFVSSANEAQASNRQRTEIPAQDLGAALKSFAAERGIVMVYRAELVSKVSTPGAKGDLTLDEALTNLLSGTQLTYKFLDEKTVTIVPVGMASVSSSGADSEAGQLRIARGAGSSSTQAAAAGSDTAQTTDQGMQQVENSPAAADSDRIEQIIVTAQKREERLQDVPIAISVLDGSDLDRSTLQSMTDVLRGVAGVSIGELFLGGTAQVPVRGVAASLATGGGSSPTAYYLDSVPFGFVETAFVPDPDVYDLERVEVLRGPQGTLYGANALNGVVRVLTRDADPSKFEVKARGLTSSTEGGSWNYRGDMAVNVPIVDGKLAARAVVGYQDLSGWIDKANDENANDAERLNARLKVNAQPTEQLSVGLSAWLSRSDYGAMSTGDDQGLSPSLVSEPIATDYDVFGLKIGYEFSAFTITSMTSYLEFSNDSLLDLAPALGGFPLELETGFAADTFAQEVVFNSSQERSWRWSTGGMYRNSEDRLYQFIDGIYLAPTRTRNLSESYALFGELTRVFLDGRFELTGGVRYFEDEVGLRETSRLTGVPPKDLINSSNKFDAVTPRLVLTWNPNEKMTVYASYSEGFRSGSHQFPAVLEVAPFPPAAPDSLTNYELGAKGSLMDGRVNFDTAIFYIDWQDVQQSVFTRVLGRDLTTLINGASASGMGFEFAVTVAPVNALQLGANFSWNDLTMDADVFSAGVPLFTKGDRVNSSPEYTWGLSADYVFPIGTNGLEGVFSASAHHTAAQEIRTIAGGTSIATTGDSMFSARTGLSIRTPEHWTATLFADNLTNEDSSPVRQAGSAYWNIRLRPRTIGLQIEYSFE